MKSIDDVRRGNLKKAIDDLFGGSQTAAAVRMGRDKPTQINHWLGGVKNMSKDSARLIEEKFGLPAFWMDAEHNFDNPDASISAPNIGVIVKSNAADISNLDAGDLPNPTSEEFAFVPQLDIAAACGNGRFEDHVVVKGGLAFKKSFLREKGVPEHAARVIYASGGSMSPTLQDGCVVLLNLADTEPRDGKVYAICKPDDGLVLKRLIWDFHPSMGRQTWILRSDNPDKIGHPDKVLPPDDRTMIAGRAVWNDNQL
jgi:phage repressor protein C with HTH and peptisase S24 domain